MTQRLILLALVDSKEVERELNKLFHRDGLTLVAVDTVARARLAVRNITPCMVLVDCLVSGAAEWATEIAQKLTMRVASIPVRLLPDGKKSSIRKQLVASESLERLVREWCGREATAAE